MCKAGSGIAWGRGEVEGIRSVGCQALAAKEAEEGFRAGHECVEERGGGQLSWSVGVGLGAKRRRQTPGSKEGGGGIQGWCKHAQLAGLLLQK